MISKQIIDAAKSLSNIFELQVNDYFDEYSKLISDRYSSSNDPNIVPPNKTGLLKEHSKKGTFTKIYDFNKSSKEIIKATKYSDDLVEFITKITLYYNDESKKPFTIFEKTQMKKENDKVWRVLNNVSCLEYMNI